MKNKRVRLDCDDCGHEITDPSDGELTWGWDDEERRRVRVVHSPYACPRWKNQTLNLPNHVQKRGTARLDGYVGRLGLLELLADIENGDFPADVGLELVRRLHVPGYEQYRVFRRAQPGDGSDDDLPAVPGRAAYREYLALKKASRASEGKE